MAITALKSHNLKTRWFFKHCSIDFNLFFSTNNQVPAIDFLLLLWITNKRFILIYWQAAFVCFIIKLIVRMNCLKRCIVWYGRKWREESYRIMVKMGRKWVLAKAFCTSRDEQKLEILGNYKLYPWLFHTV